MALDSKARIPLELYPSIIGHIYNRTDLLSMLLSSKAIVADVERKLYNTIRFGRQSDERHILFLESILDPKRPHLSGLLYHYSYVTGPDWRNTALLSLLNRALPTFTNIKQLRFGIPDEDIFTSFLALENPPFQLEFFSWIGLPIARVRPDGIGVLRFLASQHALKTLYIHNSGTNLPQISPLRNLKNLKNIIGSVPAILPLLPRSAQIERIHWIPYPNDDLDHLPLLTGLRVLSIISTRTRVLRLPLSVIAERFGTVEVLGLNSLKVC